MDLPEQLLGELDAHHPEAAQTHDAHVRADRGAVAPQRGVHGDARAHHRPRVLQGEAAGDLHCEVFVHHLGCCRSPNSFTSCRLKGNMRGIQKDQV